MWLRSCRWLFHHAALAALAIGGGLPSTAIAQRGSDEVAGLASEAVQVVDDVLSTRSSLGLPSGDDGVIRRGELIERAAERLSQASVRAALGDKGRAVREDYVQALRLLHAAYSEAVESGNAEEASAMNALIPVLADLDQAFSTERASQPLE